MAAIGQLFVELGVNIGAFVDGMDKATYKAKEGAKQIGQAFQGLGKDIEGVMSMFGEMGGTIGSAFAELGGTLSKASQLMGSVGGAAGAAAFAIIGLGAAGAAAAVGLSKMAIAGGEYVHELEMASAKTGISIENLQGLQAAGASVGLSLEAMTMGFRRFSQAISGAGRGAGAAGAILKSLGVTSHDANGALLQVADAFEKMQDGPEKAADAIALFGRAGLNMIPFLNKGAAGLREFNEMVSEYGPQVDKADKSNEEYLKSQEKMSLAWDRLTVAAEKSFLPVISKIITAMADLTKSTTNYFSSLQTEKWGDIAKFWGNLATGKPAGAGMSSAGLPTNSGNDEAAKQKALDVQDKIVAGLQKQLDLEKQGGQAGLALMQAKEKLADDERNKTPATMKDAIAIQATIPALERAAKIEKDRNEEILKRAEYIKPETDAVTDMLAKLQDQVNMQMKITESIGGTTGQMLMAKAAAEGQNEVDEKRLTLQKQLTAETQRLEKLKESKAQIASSPLIMETEAELSKLEQTAPRIIQLKQAMAAGGAVTAAYTKTTSGADQSEQQAKAMDDLVAAYGRGGSAIANAKIEEKLSGETVALDKAKSELAAFAAANGTGSKEYKNMAAGVDASTAALERHRTALQQISADDLEVKVLEQVQATKAETAAWQISTAAILMNAQARIQAAGAAAAAKFKVQNPNATGAEVSAVGADAVKQAQQTHDAEIMQLAAENDLNHSYDERIDKLKAARALMQSYGADTVLIDAQMKDALNQQLEKWDEAALKVGGLTNMFQAMANQFIMEGDKMWQNFEQAGLQAIQAVNDAVAKDVMQGNFKKFGQQMKSAAMGLGESVINAGLKKAEGSALSALGLGGLTKRDGSSAAAALYTISASPLGGAGGDMSSIGDLPMDGGGMSSFLSMISKFGGFMAEGGDTTPGKAYVVGEEHPEFFVPHTSGSIVPTVKAGGDTTQNHVAVHFHGVTDHDSFKKSQNQIGNTLANSVGRATGRR